MIILSFKTGFRNVWFKLIQIGSLFVNSAKMTISLLAIDFKNS